MLKNNRRNKPGAVIRIRDQPRICPMAHGNQVQHKSSEKAQLFRIVNCQFRIMNFEL